LVRSPTPSVVNCWPASPHALFFPRKQQREKKIDLSPQNGGARFCCTDPRSSNRLF
jgi:hypothetical protein